MSNIKKIIGIVLALVMALSVATVAFAAPEDNYSVTFTADKTEISAGESATVDVKVTTNFNAIAMTIPVFFDNSKVTVTAVATLTGASEAAELSIASIDSPTNNNLSRYYKSISYTPADHGVVALNYIAVHGDTVRAYSNESVMRLTVKALEGVSGAAVVECLEASVKTNENPNGTLLIAKNSSGTTTFDSLGEVVDNGVVTGATTTINIAGGTPVVNTLAIKDTAPSTPVIDTQYAETTGYTGFLYGMDTLGWNDDMTPEGALADYLTTALGDDYLVIEPVGDVETTGTIVKVLDADGATVLETYVFIYFGDVDMDGLVGASDAYSCEYYEMNYEGIDTLYQFIAGDIDGDTLPGASDAYFCEYYEMNYSGMPSQADIAAVASTLTYEMI